MMQNIYPNFNEGNVVFRSLPFMKLGLVFIDIAPLRNELKRYSMASDLPASQHNKGIKDAKPPQIEIWSELASVKNVIFLTT